MAASGPAHSVIPRTLRAEQLKRLSFLCGLPLSGRKDELIARLTAAASHPAAPPPKPRTGPVILSIDLGIRNLAFSLLTPVVPSTRKTGTKSKKATSPVLLGTSPPAIKLHAWQRLSLLEGPASASSQDGDEDVLEVPATTTEAFSPAALAKTANAFLQDTVLQLKPLPTHILIERQRWRTGGAAAIQQWTVRVNTLEAMLHASLHTLRDLGAWDGDVVCIQPQRVGQLFLDGLDLGTKTVAQTEEPEDDDADASTSKPRRRRAGGAKSNAEAKKLKIELLAGWLGQGDLVVQPGNVKAGHMLDAYRRASDGTKRKRSKRVAKENAEGGALTLDRKLDDLTDSLMQGMAWLRWQDNTALLGLENGVEKLLG
ncbi:mitochondrial resolvase Ydc2 [Nemania diffusa]|nr:mitochondrial resolvase Ydc2 [Nemania diffusa]